MAPGVKVGRFLCEQDAMQSLRHLIVFKAKKAVSQLDFEFKFNHLASLERLQVGIHCDGATKSNLEATEPAILNIVNRHHGRPKFELSIYNYDLVVKDEGRRGAELQDGGLDNGEDHQEKP